MGHCIALDEEDIIVPESHKTELDRRFKRHLDAPGELLTLEELQARIDEGKGIL